MGLEASWSEVNYQYVNGDLNSSAASFYEWGVANGTWHPVGSGYVPQPGDVAVYGLDSSDVIAAHVAIVIGYQPGDRGPTAVNGDGDLTAFSVVEVRTDEYLADTHPEVRRCRVTSPRATPVGHEALPWAACVSLMSSKSSSIPSARLRCRARPATIRS